MDAQEGQTYASREANVRKLGFASYEEYLRSDLWKDVRGRVKRAKGRECSLCLKPSREMHHT
jgi:hypothetical protein